jgi:hypothetical protein
MCSSEVEPCKSRTHPCCDQMSGVTSSSLVVLAFSTFRDSHGRCPHASSNSSKDQVSVPFSTARRQGRSGTQQKGVVCRTAALVSS